MTVFNTKPRVITSNTGLLIFCFGESYNCKNTELFASLQIPYDAEFHIHWIVNSMQRRFIREGDNYFQDLELVKSKYLREKSELLLDGFNSVWKAFSDRFGNYVKFIRLSSTDIASIFKQLHKDTVELFEFREHYPDVLLQRKENYG